MSRHVCWMRAVTLGLILAIGSRAAAEPLPGTKPLDLQGDPAARMVAGIDKYLDRELVRVVADRPTFWKPDYSSSESYNRSVEPNRQRLRRILGVVDKRVPVKMEYLATTDTPALIAEGDGYQVFSVRWSVLDGVDGEGLLLEPKGKPVACVVAILDADWTPEMIVGMAPGPRKQFLYGSFSDKTPLEKAIFDGWWEMSWKEAQFARHLAENGCRVLVPTLIDRNDTWSGNPRIGMMTNQTHREFIYRMAYPLGRHMIGYEIQKVLAAVDWFCREKNHPPIGLYGYSEGGLLAFYAGALDERIQTTLVSAWFGPRERLWQQPMYRNVWGLLREFGDAEIAAYLYRPHFDASGETVHRYLNVEDCRWPRVTAPAARSGRVGAAPGGIVQPPVGDMKTENDRAERLKGDQRWHKIVGNVFHSAITAKHWSLEGFLHRFGVDVKKQDGTIPVDRRKGFDPVIRQHRQFDQLVAYSQKLMQESDARRDEFFWGKLRTSSPERYQVSCETLRDYFSKEIMGRLPPPEMPANVRTRRAYAEPKWTGYEVMLDVYPDVFAYGVLLVPKDLKPGERRPVVVCQHGLEGRPQDVIDPRRETVYHSFGASLADRGYIVYAPQNPYIGGNTFRQLQRKANPLKLTMFAFITRQHERTLDWLAELPFVDAKRIGFYGLSYGGETAMRVPPLLSRYALSICSANFNRFTWKTVSMGPPPSYIFYNTYEIFDFNMGNTFSHAELAALIAPRPFMVERGHDDGVGIDEFVAHEYAKVRRLYSRLKLPERTAIEFFAGGHEIHGGGAFRFLERHLGRPR